MKDVDYHYTLHATHSKLKSSFCGAIGVPQQTDIFTATACHAFTCEHHCAVCRHDDHGANHRNFRKCTNNPGHTNFLTIQEFVDNGPSSLFCPDQEYVSEIWDVINRTVRVVTSHTSPNRPDTYRHSVIPYPLHEIRGSPYFVRYGTGFLVRGVPLRDIDTNLPCPCPDCKTSKVQTPKPEVSRYFLVSTATHVIYDDWEAESAVFEFFYDSEEDRKAVKRIFGVNVLGKELERLQTDKCQVLCVTHDPYLADILSAVDKKKKFSMLASFMQKQNVLISHPHGVSKRISFGDLVSAKRVVMNRNELPIVLKMGLKIRINGKSDIGDIVRYLNLIPCDPSPQTERQILENNFIVLRDVTITWPLCLAVEHELKAADYTSADRWQEGWCKDRWWTLPPGVQLLTGSGKRCTLPHDPTNIAESAKMEMYVDGSLFETPLVRLNDEESSPAFEFKNSFYNYYTYNMASCKGSSGGAIINRTIRLPKMSPEIATHFGGLSPNTNMSGLVENKGFDNEGPLPPTEEHMAAIEELLPFMKSDEAKEYVFGGISRCAGTSVPIKPTQTFVSLLKCLDEALPWFESDVYMRCLFGGDQPVEAEGLESNPFDDQRLKENIKSVLDTCLPLLLLEELTR